MLAPWKESYEKPRQHIKKQRHQRRQWQPTPVLLPGKSHGRSTLVGCSPWGRKESDTTAQLRFHFSLSCIGEGNGNPLQCSCLENSKDGVAWWAAVCGVTQSRTRLKWLRGSSSSSSRIIESLKLEIFRAQRGLFKQLCPGRPKMTFIIPTS